MKSSPSRSGSIELVVLGMLAALIVLLAIPVFTDIDRDLARETGKRTPPAAEALVAKKPHLQLPVRSTAPTR